MRSSVFTVFLFFITGLFAAPSDTLVEQAERYLFTYPQAAIEIYDSLLVEYPYHDGAWQGLVKGLLAQNEPRLALRTAVKGLKTLGEHPGMLQLAAWSAYQSKNYQQARSLYKRHLDATGNNSTDWSGVGWSEVQLGHLYKARKAFTTAVALDSTDTSAQEGSHVVASPWKLLFLKMGYATVENDIKNPSASLFLQWGDWMGYLYAERFKFVESRDVYAAGISPYWKDWRIWLEGWSVKGDDEYFFPGTIGALHLWYTLEAGSFDIDLVAGGAYSDWPYLTVRQADVGAVIRGDSWLAGFSISATDLHYATLSYTFNNVDYYYQLSPDVHGRLLRVYSDKDVWRGLSLGASGEWGERDYWVHPSGYLIDKILPPYRVLEAHIKYRLSGYHLLTGIKYDDEHHTMWYSELNLKLYPLEIL